MNWAQLTAHLIVFAFCSLRETKKPITWRVLRPILLIAVSIWLCYGFADRLARIFGATGVTVTTQLSPFFLVCIGVQIAWNGIKALLESVALYIG
jgi:small neutral amino acid transporter SnatA (MarC family)